MVAYLGAPEAINSATYPIGPITAVQNVQTRLASQSTRLAYVMPPESGALGFTVAALVAAKLGLAVIDADGAGRAVPSLPMLTFAAAEIDPRPAFLVSQGGLCVELDVTPRGDSNGGPTHQRDVSAIVEQMMRPVVADPEFGQFGGLAMWVMNPADIGRATPIRGTLTRALKLGRALQAGQIGSAQQMIGYLAERCGLAARAISEAGELVSADRAPHELAAERHASGRTRAGHCERWFRWHLADRLRYGRRRSRARGDWHSDHRRFSRFGLRGAHAQPAVLDRHDPAKHTRDAARSSADLYDIQDSFASIRAIECPVAPLENVDVVVVRTFEAALKAIKDDSAQAILLGCTGFVDVASRVSALLGEALGVYVPVIDPNQGGFSFLVALVRMQVRPSRLTYSKVSLQS